MGKMAGLLGVGVLWGWAGIAQAAGPEWDVAALSKAPATYPAPEVPAKVERVSSFFFDALPYHGKPTRAFAFLGLPGAAAGSKVPGMVLIHGGGGTAFEAWVKLWNQRGYAAIAMDTCGCVPLGSKGKWQRHAHGGPPGWGGFQQIDEPPADQWTYHAVADVLLAHSLLRARPEVDPQRIGLTGISWGGYLTCIVAGVDHRFRFAVPVYGCGYLGDNSTWVPTLQKMGAEKSARWLAWWDPSVYLKHAELPMLWVTGTNDFAYPMDSLQKSYRAAPGLHTLSVRIKMPHGHGGAGENPAEIRALADSILQGGQPLAKITRQGHDGPRAWAAFTSPTAITAAELTFTRDLGKWQERKWEKQPAEIDAAAQRVSAPVPADAKVYYFNLIDQRNLIVSSEHEEQR